MISSLTDLELLTLSLETFKTLKTETNNNFELSAVLNVMQILLQKDEVSKQNG